MKDKWIKYCLFVTLAGVAVMNILALNPWLAPAGDNAAYITLSQSLASGKGFSCINEPGNPPQIYFLPGFPILLSPIAYFFPDNFGAYKLVPLIFNLFAGYLIYLFFRKFLPSLQVILLVALTLLNYLIFQLATSVFSEIPYIVFSLLSIIFLTKWEDTDAHKWFFLGAISLGFTLLLRQIGIALLMATTLYFWLCRREAKKGLAILGLTCLIVLPYILRNLFVPTHPTEHSHLVDFLWKESYNPDAGYLDLLTLLKRSFQAVGFYLSSFGRIFFGPLRRGTTPVSLTMLALVVVGGLNEWRRKRLRVITLYMVLYLLIICCLGRPSIRLLVGLIPFIVYYFIMGMNYIFHFLLRGRKKLVLGAISGVAGAILLNSFFWDVQLIKARQDFVYPPDWASYLLTCEWVKENTPAESVVMARKRYFSYLYSDRKTLRYPFTYNRKEIMKVIKERGVNYVVVDCFGWTDTTERYLKPIIEENPEKFELVAKIGNPATYVFRIKPQTNYLATD